MVSSIFPFFFEDIIKRYKLSPSTSTVVWAPQLAAFLVSRSCRRSWDGHFLLRYIWKHVVSETLGFSRTWKLK